MSQTAARFFKRETVVVRKFGVVLCLAALCLCRGSTSEAADFSELCRTGTLEQVKSALDAGANVNERGILGTPLIQALRKAAEQPELYKLLLRRGADVNLEDPAR